MTISTVKIQDKDSHKKLSVVQSTEDPTKWWVVILNPDGSPIAPTWNLVKWPNSSTDWDIALFDWTDWHKIKDSWKKLSDFVDITNNQTVGWVKTFTSEPVLPAKSSAPDSSKTTSPATETQVAWMVSDTAYASSWDWVTDKAPSQNAVYDKINAMDTTIGNKANDADVVKLTWNQTISWTKTFSSEPVIPSKSALPVSPSNTSPATEWQVEAVKNAIPAVVDALNSTSTTSALSANQWKNLNDSISTINGKIPSAASTTNLLADTNYVNDSINSITAYYITKNAQGDQFATYAELAAATTFYSWWVARIPTRNDYCIVLDDENHDHWTTRYIYQNNQWEYQYTVNETALTQAQLDALNSGITAWKVSTYDWYATTISWKQDALTLPSTPTQWNLVVRWANNKTIADGWAIPTWFSPSNTWTTGQVLTKTAWGYEYADAPVTSVNGSTGAVTVNGFNPWGTATTGYVVKKTADGYEWAAESWAVTSVNWQTWAVTVTEVPSGWTDWQVLSKVSGNIAWANPSGWDVQVSTQANNILTSWTKLRCGTEANYSSLGTYDSNCIYLTI